MIPKWELLSSGESIRTELSRLILIPQSNKDAGNAQTDEELNVSMTQFGRSLSNWGCLASEGPLGGLPWIALVERSLLLLPREPRGRKHVQNTDHVSRTLPGLCLRNTRWDIHAFFIYSSKSIASHLWAKLCVTVSEKKSSEMCKTEKLHRDRNS